MAWWDLNQISSRSTRLTIEIGTPKTRAATRVIRSKARSGRSSRILYRRTAASRCSSFADIVLEFAEGTVAPPDSRFPQSLANSPLHAYGCLHLPLPHKQDHRVKKILLVDDESNMRFVLRIILESGGYEVVAAQHGAAALEALRRSGADLVLTDLMMPVMSGRELVERLRADQETADIPIVVVTATHELVLPNADAVIAKPFDDEELLAVVRSLTEKEQA
jgi:CheY-like chemotaxis protein